MLRLLKGFQKEKDRQDQCFKVINLFQSQAEHNVILKFQKCEEINFSFQHWASN